MSTASLGTRVWRNKHFYLFVSPFFVSFALFGLYPLLASLHYSTLDWDGIGVPREIGLANYRRLAGDSQFWQAILNTLLIFAFHVPVMLVLSFLLAVCLNGPVTRFRALFRASIFVPVVTPVVVVAIVFSLIYQPSAGLLNWFLRALLEPFAPAFTGLAWRDNGYLFRVSVSILLIWRWTGYNMVLMLAGLQGIPHEVYEAARIDGASRWQILTRVTLPLMWPTFVFCGIMSLLGTFYAFDEIFMLVTDGSRVQGRNIGLLLFEESFMKFNFGYASAMAYTVAAMIIAVSVLILRVTRKAAA
jgi:cellobiose transport system permease protein